MYKKKAFTLVELIVVISILSILWTIAFVSMTKYSGSSRDSMRATDSRIMESSLNLFFIDSSRYPEPTNWTVITYSWSEVWNQWVFWSSMAINLKNIAEIPVDPLTEKKYTYSVNNLRNEFQLAWILESDIMVYDSLLLPTTNAGNLTAKAYIVWNYNWMMSRVFMGNNIYVLAVPSIISSISWTLEEILINNWLVLNWYDNLSFDYENSQYITTWEDNFILVNENNVEVYYWPVSNLSINSYQVDFIKKIQNAYSWTISTNISWIGNILNYDTVNNVEKTIFIAQNLIKSHIDSNVIIKK